MVGVYLVPKFGFVTDRNKPKEPKGRPVRVFTTRPYFVELKGVEPCDIDFEVVKLTKASPGLTVALCEGRRGEGFYICRKYGAGFRVRKSTQRGIAATNEQPSIRTRTNWILIVVVIAIVIGETFDYDNDYDSE